MNFPQQGPAEFIAEIERAGTRRAMPAGQGEIVWRVFGRGDPVVLLHGGTGMNVPRPTMEPLQSWRRLATDEEKRAVHRRNLGILMIHEERNIDDLAVYIQSVNAAKSRVRGKHVSHTGALARCLENFLGRLAGIWGEYDATAAPYLAERRAMLQQFQPTATFDILPGAGHWVQYEAHAAFNLLFRETLKRGA